LVSQSLTQQALQQEHLIKGKNGGHIYAVKEFRQNCSGESEKEYQKKVMAEFCVSSMPELPNIIEMVNMVHDHDHYYKVCLLYI